MNSSLTPRTPAQQAQDNNRSDGGQFQPVVRATIPPPESLDDDTIQPGVVFDASQFQPDDFNERGQVLEDSFYDAYSPVASPDGSDCWGETDAAEVDEAHVWTVVDDDGGQVACAGFDPKYAAYFMVTQKARREQDCHVTAWVFDDGEG